MQTILVIVALLVALYVWAKPKKLNMPGPPANPLFGNLLSMDLAHIYRATHQMHLKYGPAVQFWIGPFRRIISVSDPEMVKDILATTGKVYTRGQKVRDVVESCKTFGMFTMEGENWKIHRNSLTFLFDMNHLKENPPMAKKSVDLFLNKWEQTGGKTTDVNSDVYCLLMDLSGKMMLGVDINSQAGSTHMQNLLNTVMKGLNIRVLVPTFMWKYTPTPEKKRYDQANNALNDIVDKQLEQWKNTKDENGHDLLALIHSKTNFSADEIRNEARTFFVAGFETTAKTLSWAIYLLASHPKVQQKLISEIDKTANNSGELRSYETMQEIPYLNWIIDEAMRLYPISPVLMRTPEHGTCIIDGVQVPLGTEVLVAVWAIHRDEKLWKNPNDFIPERWDSTSEYHTPNQATNLGFGGGPRSCIGKRFAMTTMKTILCAIFSKFELSIPAGFVPEEVFDFTLGPDKLLLNINKRKL